MKYIEAIYDCETGTETFVEREYTKEQLESQKQLADERKAIADKEAARNAVYLKLGLTAEDITALVG
jgi:hypothetical protein